MRFTFSNEQKKGIAYSSNNGDHAVIHLNRRVAMESVKKVASSFGFTVDHHFKNRHQWDVFHGEAMVASVMNENLIVLSNKLTTNEKKAAVDFVNALLEEK